MQFILVDLHSPLFENIFFIKTVLLLFLIANKKSGLSIIYKMVSFWGELDTHTHTHTYIYLTIMRSDVLDKSVASAQTFLVEV